MGQGVAPDEAMVAVDADLDLYYLGRGVRKNLGVALYYSAFPRPLRLINAGLRCDGGACGAHPCLCGTQAR
jgi:hypothetical protein